MKPIDSTLSSEGFLSDENPAKICHTQDHEQVWKVIDPASGPPWSSAFAFYNHDWPSSKTSQDSCEPWLADQASLLSESSSLIWPNSGTTLDGVAYELPMWELHISDLESLSLLGNELLPTPGANDRTGAESSQERSQRGAGGYALRDLPKMLPTPAAQEPGGTVERHLERKNVLDGANRVTPTHLSLAIKTLPTPTAQDATSSGNRNLPGSKAHAGISLTDIVREDRLLPTPTTQDGANNAGPSQQRRNSDPLNVVATKLLPTPAAKTAGRGKGDAQRYRGPKSQEGRRSNLEDAMEAVKEESPWIQEESIGVSFSQLSSDGAGSPDQHPDQLTVWDV